MTRRPDNKVFEISVIDLRFHANHGVFPQETEVGNEFRVDVTVKFPFNQRIYDDDISATVSYADIFEIVKTEMEIPRKLLESVASSIADRLTETFPDIISGTVAIEKSTPPIPHFNGIARVLLSF